MTLAQQIKSTRKQLDLSQITASIQIGIAYQTLQLYERGWLPKRSSRTRQLIEEWLINNKPTKH